MLWSCTTCGACVEQCPVDIEHVDHIVDMRRYQVLIESAFPSEAGVDAANLENKGNPWGMADRGRDWSGPRAWTSRCPSSADGERPRRDVEYLFWVGCAGALEDRAKKTTRAFAELLHIAGVKFAVLGADETCTGDPARRLGNEFVFQMLGPAERRDAQRGRRRQTKIVATCPHCFNTLGNEYPQLGGNYEVVHHTQLLGQLVARGPAHPGHPGRRAGHLPRPVLPRPAQQGLHTAARDPRPRCPACAPQEMHRCKERGFCCGAGGARMWMEEKIGKRINVERVDEALGTRPRHRSPPPARSAW